MKLRMKLFLGFLVVIAVVVVVVAVLVRGVAVGAVSSHMGQGMGGMMGGGMMADVESAVARGVTDALIVAALVAVTVAAVASYLLSGVITATIGEMAGAARRIAAGEYAQRVVHPAKDEIGEFADAFNEMASRLDQTEQVRRELLATISHELRTPVTVIVEPATPHVRANEDRLLQVLLNVVGNSFKYTPPGGNVNLRAGPAPREWAEELRPRPGSGSAAGYVLFQIEDTGIGSPAGGLARVRERFHRVDKTRSAAGIPMPVSSIWKST